MHPLSRHHEFVGQKPILKNIIVDFKNNTVHRLFYCRFQKNTVRRSFYCRFQNTRHSLTRPLPFPITYTSKEHAILKNTILNVLIDQPKKKQDHSPQGKT